MAGKESTFRWRLLARPGGLLCLGGVLYIRYAVTAREGPKTDKEKFKEVEQSLTWQMEMPDGLICGGKPVIATI